MKVVYKKNLTNSLLELGHHLNIKIGLYYRLVAFLNIIKISKNWPSIFWRHLTHKPVSVILRKDVVFDGISDADLTMLTETWAIGEYSPEGFDIGVDDTVIDIGAHIGFFSLYAAQRTKKRILSYEPMPRNYHRLVENIRINNIENIKPYKLAIADTKGVRTFYPSEEHNGCHSLYNRGEKGRIKVKTIRLKDIFKDNNITKCDFLKIDCEGAEYEILMGSDRSILMKIDKIVGELHESLQDSYTNNQLRKHLEECGFSTAIKWGNLYAKNKKFRSSKH